MKIVTLDEALASGRRFRRKDLGGPTAHSNEPGRHIWRIKSHLSPEEVRFKPGLRQDVVIACTECNTLMSPYVTDPDEYIIEQSDEELERESLNIINKLGLKLKDKVTA